MAMQIPTLPDIAVKRSAMRVQRAVLQALVIRELRARVEGRWLGLLWMLFEPLTNLLLMLAIYGFRSHATSPDVELPVYLITGMLPFFMFRNLAQRLPSAIAGNRGLYAYRQVKPIDALLARAIVEIGLSSAVYLTALSLLGWLGYHWLPVEPLELIVVSAVLLLLGASLGLLFSVLVHSRPKVQSVVNMIFFPLYLLSGVLFPVHFVPEAYRDWLLLNPVLHLIDLARSHFIPNYQPLPEANLAYPAAFMLVTLALAISLYRVYRFRLLSAD